MREQRQQRLLFLAVGGVALVSLLVVGFGTLREFVIYPREAVAYVGGDPVTLRVFTDALAEEMRQLQSQVAAGTKDQTNPNAVSGQVQRLIESQERLPEEVLDKEIETLIIRREAERRGISVSKTDVDNKINEFLSVQREILNLPTPTPAPTTTTRPSSTPTPEGFDPTPTVTATITPDPLTPSPTWDPRIPTLTRTPFPTRLTNTPNVTPTLPPTMQTDEFDRAYRQFSPQLKSEDRYRTSIEQQLLRERVRDAIAAMLPASGPAAHVLRIASSTKDEATIALLQLKQFEYPLEEVVAQVSDRPAEGKRSGDLGWVARGAETPGFDEIVFDPNTPFNEWTEPFPSGNHFEVVQVLERRDSMPYDTGNRDSMRDRAFKEWMDSRKIASDVERDMSAQERQWAIDRASKGIIETTTDRNR